MKGLLLQCDGYLVKHDFCGCLVGLVPSFFNIKLESLIESPCLFLAAELLSQNVLNVPFQLSKSDFAWHCESCTGIDLAWRFLFFLGLFKEVVDTLFSCRKVLSFVLKAQLQLISLLDYLLP